MTTLIGHMKDWSRTLRLNAASVTLAPFVAIARAEAFGHPVRAWDDLTRAERAELIKRSADFLRSIELMEVTIEKRA